MKSEERLLHENPEAHEAPEAYEGQDASGAHAHGGAHHGHGHGEFDQAQRHAHRHGCQKPLCVALAGNPNCGKTTAFNAFTGSHQHVGNYPGVTVEKKEGFLVHKGQPVVMVDLPGTYSLTAYSQEELVTRAVLAPEKAEDKPLVVLDVVDASALERNLFLAVQIMEMGLPVALACNMMDEARASGIVVDTEALGKALGAPVTGTVARNGSGLSDALDAALSFAGKGGFTPLRITYGPDLDPVLERMECLINQHSFLTARYPARWIALKMLEQDAQLLEEGKAANAVVTESLLAERAGLAQHLAATLKVTPEALIADYRYGFIRGVVRGAVTVDNTRHRLALTDKLDSVFTNAFFGPLLMLAVMYLMFQITFQLGAYPQGWVENLFGLLGEGVDQLLPDGLLKSLLISGVIDGVGGVVSFVPLIMIMFLLIAFLEDSGYMARIAFMLDRVFRAFGLHGCSVMPYIVSGGIAGGCAIPGVMATRTLRSPKEKLATLLTLPFMACGAKLPVFLLLTGVFFPGKEAGTMFLLTLTGWIAALLVARLLRSTVIRGEATPFVMELPPYRLPGLGSLAIHCWERTWLYLKKAGTVLVAVSILIWASMTFPSLSAEEAAPFEAVVAQAEAQLEQNPGEEAEMALLEARGALDREQLRRSAAGRLGVAMEPLTMAAGFDWRTDIALLGGIAAKEAIVSTLGTAYSLSGQDDEDGTTLARRISGDQGWSQAVAVALMLFVLLYSPCFVALVVIRQETGSWGWMLFSMVFNTALAFGVAVTAYHLGRLAWG